MSDQEYRVRIKDMHDITVLDAVFRTFSMAHRFLDDQTLHDGDVVSITEREWLIPTFKNGVITYDA